MTKLRDLQFDLTPTTRDLHGDENPRDVLQKACEEFKADEAVNLKETARRAYRNATGQTANDEIAKLRVALRDALDMLDAIATYYPACDDYEIKSDALRPRIAELRRLVSE